MESAADQGNSCAIIDSIQAGGHLLTVRTMMANDREVEFLEARIAQERALEARSTDPGGKASHRTMADAYSARIDAARPGAARSGVGAV